MGTGAGGMGANGCWMGLVLEASRALLAERDEWSDGAAAVWCERVVLCRLKTD